MADDQAKLDAARTAFVRLSVDDARSIDEVCDFYEHQLQMHGRPKIEDLLGGVRESLRPILFRELLLLETESASFDERSTGRDKLRRRFAPYAVIVDEVFDALFPEEGPPLVQAAPSPDETWPTIPNYRILRERSRGGMGKVFEAIHTKLGNRVALKVLHSNLAHDLGAESRFDREMKVIGTLVHPNIVQARDAGTAGGVHYLVMELIDGLDLYDLLKRVGPLTIPNACEIVRRTALALQNAHERNLVHRDVKPKNILLGRSAGMPREAEVKVVDFGLALLRSISSSRDVVAQPSGVVGTFPYMAPEQYWEQTGDIRADVYSLGCTLYCLLSGRPPFGPPQFTTPQQIMTAHRDVPLPSLRTARPDVGEALAGVVAAMTAKDPQRRYPTPGDAAEALAAFTKGHHLTELLARAVGETSAVEEPREKDREPPRRPPPVVDLEQTSAYDSSAAAAELDEPPRGEPSFDRDRPTPAAYESPRRVSRRAVAWSTGALLVVGPLAAWFAFARTTPVDLSAAVADELPAGWRRDGRVLVSPDSPHARLSFPVDPPQQYRLEIEAERISGGRLAVGLVWRGAVVQLPLETMQIVVDSPADGRVDPQASLPLDEFGFTGGTPHTFTCIVRPAGYLAAYEDDVKYAVTAPAAESPAESAAAAPRLYLETHYSIYRFRRITLTPLAR